MCNDVKRVLIAHQSTIPHYRIPFYNTLERLRPKGWCFEVVFDASELKSSLFFQESLDIKQFNFPIVKVKTFSLKLLDKRISYQVFLKRAAKYDLIIVENALNNLSYPLCQFHRIRGKKIAYWGHDRDRHFNSKEISGLKLMSEKIKLILSQSANGFFAYTKGVKLSLQHKGFSPHNIFVLNNTIDINEQRKVYNKWCLKRDSSRNRLGLNGKKVLLFVGRFTKNKRIDFLLKSFSILQKMQKGFHLCLVGSGGESYLSGNSNNISYFGSIVDLDKLAPIYTASDILVFPGSVGLGPLQALCYDLPVITIDSDIHMPEIEYLSSDNSIILPSGTTPEMYAQAIKKLFSDQNKLSDLRETTWTSIKHLTIENMVKNFINGVNVILGIE